MDKANILVIDDDPDIRTILSAVFKKKGASVDSAADFTHSMALITENVYDLVFVDIVLPGEKTGMDFLREIRQRGITCPVIVFTGLPDLDTATEAVRLGAFDYLVKPLERDRLVHIAQNALNFRRIHEEKEGYRTTLEAVLNSVNEGIIAVAPDLSVIQANEAAARLCDFDQEGVLGRSFEEVGGACSKRCLETLRAPLSSGFPAESRRLECRRGDRPGQVVNVFAKNLYDSDSETTGAVMVIHDQTRLAELESGSKRLRVFHGMIGKSDCMRRVYSLIEDLADVRTTVLITGESGTGKELVAKALHEDGLRAGKPFVKVNCAALPDTLLESELFGHVRGAFTGAMKDKAGRFAAAHGGTIFLDEIGDISPRMQAMLLRVLQEGEFERVGDNRTIKVDVRVIAATNKDLLREMQEGRYRQDLYYRLHVAEIHLPSLSERKEDIPLLVDHFLNESAKRINKKVVGVSNEVMEAVMGLPFPGNIRELEHLIESACVVCHGDILTMEHMPEGMSAPVLSGKENTDRKVLLDALESCLWNKSAAARKLGMSRRHLYRKMEKYGIVTPGGGEGNPSG
ncbi:MAG: sigma-54 dependent transcriptional regulator [Desulfatibacillaceae bacterium]